MAFKWDEARYQAAVNLFREGMTIAAVSREMLLRFPLVKKIFEEGSPPEFPPIKDILVPSEENEGPREVERAPIDPPQSSPRAASNPPPAAPSPVDLVPAAPAAPPVVDKADAAMADLREGLVEALPREGIAIKVLREQTIGAAGSLMKLTQGLDDFAATLRDHFKTQVSVGNPTKALGFYMLLQRAQGQSIQNMQALMKIQRLIVGLPESIKEERVTSTGTVELIDHTREVVEGLDAIQRERQRAEQSNRWFIDANVVEDVETESGGDA